MKVIDMHAHLWYGRNASGEKQILDTVERYGIEEIYISTWTNSHKYNIKINASSVNINSI